MTEKEMDAVLLDFVDSERASDRNEQQWDADDPVRGLRSRSAGWRTAAQRLPGQDCRSSLSRFSPCCWNDPARWSHGKNCRAACGPPTRLSTSTTVSMPPSAGSGMHWATAPRTRVLLRRWPAGATGFWRRSTVGLTLAVATLSFRSPPASLRAIGGSPPERQRCCCWWDWVWDCSWAGADRCRLLPSPPIAERRLTANPSEFPVRSAALSYDGKYLAFSDDTGSYLRQVDTGETHPLALPEGFKARARYLVSRWLAHSGNFRRRTCGAAGFVADLRPGRQSAQTRRSGPRSRGITRRLADRVSERRPEKPGSSG